MVVLRQVKGKARNALGRGGEHGGFCIILLLIIICQIEIFSNYLETLFIFLTKQVWTRSSSY